MRYNLYYNIMRYEILLYQDKYGKSDVSEFIASCERKMKAKIIRYIELLSEYGNTLRPPYSEYLKDDIFELRIKQGNNISRVLYFFMDDKKLF